MTSKIVLQWRQQCEAFLQTYSTIQLHSRFYFIHCKGSKWERSQFSRRVQSKRECRRLWAMGMEKWIHYLSQGGDTDSQCTWKPSLRPTIFLWPSWSTGLPDATEQKTKPHYEIPWTLPSQFQSLYTTFFPCKGDLGEKPFMGTGHSHCCRPIDWCSNVQHALHYNKFSHFSLCPGTARVSASSSIRCFRIQ